MGVTANRCQFREVVGHEGQLGPIVHEGVRIQGEGSDILVGNYPQGWLPVVGNYRVVWTSEETISLNGNTIVQIRGLAGSLQSFQAAVGGCFAGQIGEQSKRALKLGQKFVLLPDRRLFINDYNHHGLWVEPFRDEDTKHDGKLVSAELDGTHPVEVCRLQEGSRPTVDLWTVQIGGLCPGPNEASIDRDLFCRCFRTA